MSLRENQSKFWKMVSLLIQYAESLHNEPIVILDWDRTVKEQRVLVARGASKTMNSKHLQGLAVDICFLNDLKDDRRINYLKKKYEPLGLFWESMGGRWGGRFGAPKDSGKLGWDYGHMEYKG